MIPRFIHAAGQSRYRAHLIRLFPPLRNFFQKALAKRLFPELALNGFAIAPPGAILRPAARRRLPSFPSE
jgi:hypothetical protein